MLEVNAQWQFHHAPLGSISFTNDIERIQHHLLLVHKELSEVSTDQLTESQRLNRQALLDTLLEYANAAKFPINTGHAERTPYFIDNYGTACAVGYLIIASGHGETADYLSENFNFDFLVNMPKEPVLTWADVHGFEFSELEWIQPAYDYYPTLRFLPVDDAVEGPVYKTKYFAADQISCFGGDFSSTGQGNFACFDETGLLYETLLQDELGTVNDFSRIQTGWFALAGCFELPNGEQRGFLNTKADSSFYVDLSGQDYTSHTVHGSNGYLLFDADFGAQSSALEFIHYTEDVAHEILRVNGEINSIQRFGDYIVVGGDFTEITTPYDTLQNENLVAWKDSTLYTLGSPFKEEIRALRIIDGDLYAAGHCDLSSPDSSCILKYDGTNWIGVFDSIAIAELQFSNPSVLWFSDVYKYEDALLTSGYLEYCSLGSFNYYCARHLIQIKDDGQIQHYGFFNGHVRSLSQTPSGDLLVGGQFTNHAYHLEGGGWMQYSYFGSPYLAHSAAELTGVDQYEDRTSLSIYPMPSSDRITIDLGRRATDWSVKDISGKIVAVDAQASEAGLNMNVSNLSPGSYFINLSDQSGQVHQAQFIVRPY